MAVWFSACSANHWRCFCAEIALDVGSVEAPTNDLRNNVLRTPERAHELKHGGAIAAERIQAGVRPAKTHQGGTHDESNPT